MKKNPVYIAIDLKSFYASVECVERGLDPITTNLVVADPSRTEKTICLAVSPSLKSYGISGRARLFEAVQRIKEVNLQRQFNTRGKKLTGESYNNLDLIARPDLAVSFITAPPRMALYIEYSARIYNIYLKYVAPEDIHVYSIDEVFMDVTNYMDTYHLTPHEMTMMIIQDVLKTTGITATGGVGTNLYLAKVAMDIQAKHIEPDEDGVRIAELDEQSYRELLWSHKPLTDFWRVGRGYAKKLEENGMFTMGDVARCSIGKPNQRRNENLLYKLFGINAELLIDHAWGWEPCTMADIKGYKPSTNSISSGQVLHTPYTFDKAKLIVREMTELLVLDLVSKGLVTDQMVLSVGYDIENLANTERSVSYQGEIKTDYYGRKIPKHAHGSTNLSRQTSSTTLIIDAVMALFDRIMDRNLFVRRVNIAANHVVSENEVQCTENFQQLDMFTDYEAATRKKVEEDEALVREKKRQEAIIEIKKKFGKNAILKGTNLEEGATSLLRNRQIGGHKA